VNKYGVLSSILLGLLLFLPRIPLAILFSQETNFSMVVGLWLPLDFYHVNGARFYSIGVIDNYWSVVAWLDYNGASLMLVLFWVLPLIAFLFTLIFSIFISKTGIKYFKISFTIMLIQNLCILFFPTVFGHYYLFPVYFFNELPSILGYGAYTSFIITIFLYLGLRQYLIMEED
jgi:hypothetical protein